MVRIEPRAVGIHEDLADLGIQPLHGDLVARTAADAQHDVGPVRVRERVAPQERVVRGDRARDPQVGDRVGEHRPSGDLGEREHGLRFDIGAPARDDQPARRPPHEPGERLTHPVTRCTRARRARGPRTTVGPVGRADERLTGRHQGLPERQVQVHRAGGRPEGLRHRARRGGAPEPPRSVPILRCARVAEPAHRVAVELLLIDGLAGAGVTQLGRTIRSADDERDPCMVGLEHRRVEVRRRGAGRAQHDCRPPTRLAEPEREERRRSLVEVHVQPDPRVVGKCERERCRARARRETCVGHAVAHPLVDQRAGERGGGVATHGMITP